jgi:hypothetical protein
MVETEYNVEGKALYSSQELLASPSWNLSRFLSADRKREIERAEKKDTRADAVFTLIEFIDENKIPSFSVFLRRISKEMPNLKTVAVEKHTLFRDYINSATDYRLHFEEIDEKYRKREKEIELKYQLKYEEWGRKVYDKLALREGQIADLASFIMKLTKTPPAVKELEEIYAQWAEEEKVYAEIDAQNLFDSEIY